MYQEKRNNFELCIYMVARNIFVSFCPKPHQLATQRSEKTEEEEEKGNTKLYRIATEVVSISSH